MRLPRRPAEDVAVAGFSPCYAARLDDHRAALRLVAAGVGVTVLPRLAVPELFEGLVAKPLVRPAVARRIVVHAGQTVRSAQQPDRRRDDTR